MLVILEKMESNRLSQDNSNGDIKAGDVRSMWRSFGMAKELRSIVKAS